MRPYSEIMLNLSLILMNICTRQIFFSHKHKMNLLKPAKSDMNEQPIKMVSLPYWMCIDPICESQTVSKQVISSSISPRDLLRDVACAL